MYYGSQSYIGLLLPFLLTICDFISLSASGQYIWFLAVYVFRRFEGKCCLKNCR